MSEDALAPWRTIPAALLSSTTAETALRWSVMSVTFAPFDVTSVTRPTSPSAVTTGAFSAMPWSRPAAITISCWYGVGGRPTTLATMLS